MRGFDAANMIVGESVGVDGSAVANDPALQKLSLCIDDLLPVLNRVCRVHGEGAAMHAMIALTASMARNVGIEQSIAAAFRVNAAMLEASPFRRAPPPRPEKGRTSNRMDLGAWFRQRMNEILVSAQRGRRAARMVSPCPVADHQNDVGQRASYPAPEAEHANATLSGASR